ncbi:MAG: ABC transporter permease [Pirellulales bacterium]
MFAFIVKRLLSLIPTLFVALTVSFFLIRLAPGSPFLNERALSSEVREALEAKYGFDQPMAVQYLTYVGNLLRGDLGLSTKYPQRTVNEIIALGFPVTLLLAAGALCWALLVGIAAGTIGAVRQNSWLDHSAMLLALTGIGVPSLVLGPVLIFVFSLSWYVLPPGGWGTWSHMILPSLTLGTVYAAYIARLTRTGVLEVIRSDYIRTARAKGLSEPLVIVRHLLRGGLLPVVTFLGPAVAHLLVGSVVVEKIFNTPGIGPYFVDAAINRDYFLVMGIILLESVFLLGMNLLVDIAYGWLDPRIRYE